MRLIITVGKIERDLARRDGRDESVVRRCIAESRFEIADFLVYRLGVAHLDRSVQDRQAQVLRTFAAECILGDAGGVGKVGSHEIGFALEARHPLQHVVREADLAEFAVADHIDADLLLTRNHFGNSRADARVERDLINRLVIEQVVKHSSNIIGPRQAASVSRQKCSVLNCIIHSLFDRTSGSVL